MSPFCTGRATWICKACWRIRRSDSGAIGRAILLPGRSMARPCHVALRCQPSQFLGEQGDALTIAARHARDVGAPEEPLGPVCIEDPMQPVVDIAKRIG